MNKKHFNNGKKVTGIETRPSGNQDFQQNCDEKVQIDTPEVSDSTYLDILKNKS